MFIRIKRNDEIFGPYSIEEARVYLSSGRLSLADLGQLEGDSEWSQLASVHGLQSPPPPPVAPPEPGPNHPDERALKVEPKVHIGGVIRDVVIFSVITGTGGVISELAAHNPDLAKAMWNIFLSSVAFIIVGCIAKGARWRHLMWVALGVWLVCLFKVLLGWNSLTFWLAEACLISLLVGIGGALSLLIKKQ